jgi:hypothetical protein
MGRRVAAPLPSEDHEGRQSTGRPRQSEHCLLEPDAERFVRGETKALPIDRCMLLVLISCVLSEVLLLSLSVLVKLHLINRTQVTFCAPRADCQSQLGGVRASFQAQLRHSC